MSHQDLRVPKIYFKFLFREGYKHLKELWITWVVLRFNDGHWALPNGQPYNAMGWLDIRQASHRANVPSGSESATDVYFQKAEYDCI